MSQRHETRSSLEKCSALKLYKMTVEENNIKI